MTNKDGGGGGQFLDFIFRLYDFTDKYQQSIFWGFQFQFFGGVLVTAAVFLGCSIKAVF